MASRYWVGGSGTWDASNTANWSATSGGAGGASVPGSADAAFLDANSGTVTVTLAYSPTLVNLFCAGFTGTLDFQSNKVSLSGASTTVFSQSSTMTVLGTPLIEFTANSASNRTFSASSVTEANAISLSVLAGTAAVSISGSVKNLDFTGFSGSFGAIACTVFGNLTIPNTMTVTATTNVITLGATSGTQQITTNGVTIDRPITQNSPGATLQLQDNLTMGSTRAFTLTAGTLDLNNLTLSTGLFSSSNSNTRSIAFGTGNIAVVGNGATVWTTSNMNGFTYTGTPTINLTYSGATGTRTVLTGNTSNGANETNVLNFNITAGTDTVVLGTGVKNLNFTGFAGTASDNSRTIFGDLTLSSGMTLGAGTGVLTFAATSGTKQITTNGKTIDCPITFNGAGGTFAFQDDLTQGSTRAFTVTNGTVQLKNSVTSTVGSFVTSGTNQKFLQSTTPGLQATISQASGNVSASYLSIKDINATGGANWVARTDLGSKDLGNNTGWNFIYIAIQQILKPIMDKILKPIILN